MTGFLAVVLVCAAGIAGPVLATHLTLGPGEFHKVACERRKG